MLCNTRFRYRDHANKARGAVGGAGQVREQQPVIRFIRGMRSGITRRLDARRSAQEVHFKARVIGKQRARCEPAVILRFDQRILFEGDPGFYRRPYALQAVEGPDVDAEQFARQVELAQLSRVSGRTINLHVQAASITFFCNASSSSIPVRASAFIRSSCVSSKLLCSAVAWNSTNRPPSVMTIFASTSARESS